MSVKMNIARLRMEVVPLDRYQEEYRGRLCCGFCEARVEFVHEYNYSRKSSIIHVPRYYRLAKGDVHRETCIFDVVRLKKTILADVGDRRLISDYNGRLVVRILLREGDGDGGGRHRIEDVFHPRGFGREPVFIKEGTKSAYVSSVLKLSRLRFYLQDKDEIRRDVILQVPNNEGTLCDVSWDYFCFEQNDLKRLYELISNGTLNHAICIVGRAKAKIKYSGEKIISIEQIEDNRHYTFECAVGDALFAKIQGGVEVCIYLWKFSSRVPSEWNEVIIYHNIDGSILDDRQILIL